VKLSVVIVNYNVKFFLEQCLYSVQKAVQHIAAEVWVVDNNSVDGSVQHIAALFPWVKIIANEKNTGFSYANNQAMREASGEYILLLNPDTVVAEDTFQKCIAFMDSHKDAGGLGVKMIDGKGIFLPESKRGLPTPSVSFYKMFGLSAFFPKSTTFGRYHLGFLDKDKTNPVEILSGAFMLMRKEALDKVGLLDETFFMYGEDIDLSYRIIKGGWQNYYFSGTTIIHYKGESTKKGSVNYVKVFYQAMIIFAQKHFTGGRANLFAFLINAAVVVRALMTLLSGILSSAALYIIDALLIFAGVFALEEYWAANIKFSASYYPAQFLSMVVPAYIFLWISMVFISGGYQKPYRLGAIIRGVAIGTLIIAAVYGLLPNEWRFSRALILLGGAWSIFSMILTRTIYNLTRHGQFTFEATSDKNILVAGSDAEANKAIKLLKEADIDAEFTIIHHLAEIQPLAPLFDINEIIYCAQDFSFKEIVASIQQSGPAFEYKILNAHSNVIIGSNSKNTAGDLYTTDVNYMLGNTLSLQKKRLFDIITAILFLVLSPLLAIKLPSFSTFIQNCFQVLSGKKTWVGYIAGNNRNLPEIAGAAVDLAYNKPIDPARAVLLNKRYAKHYTLQKDIKVLFRWLKGSESIK
jgi:GT2 family glycosyltransferase